MTLSNPPIVPRECHPCTACCDGWLEVNVPGAHAWKDHPCSHRTDAGCGIFGNKDRPQLCEKFLCAWRVKGSPFPEWMRPDLSKVIVMFSRFAWQGMQVDIAVPMGHSVLPQPLDWLKRFAEINQRPLMWAEQIMENGVYIDRWRFGAHGPPAFQKEMAERIGNGESPWKDGSAAEFGIPKAEANTPQ